MKSSFMLWKKKKEEKVLEPVDIKTGIDLLVYAYLDDGVVELNPSLMLRKMSKLPADLPVR